MKFSIGAVVAFAVAVLAKPIFLNSNYQVEEGKPFTLKWSNAQGPVTITLMTGPPDNLKKVTDLTTGETGSEFTYTPEGLPSGSYAFRITDGAGEVNYSSSFEYVGTGSLSTTATSLTTSLSSTSASVSSTTSSESSTTESSTTSSTSGTSSTSSESSSTTSTFTTTTRPATTTRVAQPTVTPDNTNNAQGFASPLALVLVTVAALVFFH